MSFNELNPAQAERLALLIEECAEVQQAATKILRHGYSSQHPETEVVNQDSLEQELGDLLAAIHLLEVYGDVSGKSLHLARMSKLDRVWSFLHEQPLRPSGVP